MTLRRIGLIGCVLAVLAALGSAQQYDPALYAGMKWRLIGPFRGGRTVPAEGIPGQPHTFFIGVNNGGVWKTTDAGQTWTPIFDSQPTQSVGALALAPSDPNILYVGSGEGLRRPDLATGDGVYKSTDGGRTWRHLGLADGQQIGAILVDPRDPNRLLVAVLGHPYGPNQERGVFRSLDGGQTWKKVLYRDPDTGAVDLAFDPRNPRTVYAVLWTSRRPPWTVGNTYEAAGSGLFRSTDGGDTWQPIGEGLPTWEKGHLGRIGITLAPSDPDRMYALVDSPTLGGLYRSDDAGLRWTRVNTDNRIWGRGSDFAWVRVHPRNKDVVFVPNIAAYRSDDAGKTFTAIKGAPGGDDYHSIWINPANPEIMIMGSDQGATVSLNGGQSWSSWYNQPTAQLYHVTTDNQFPYRVYGGQQESGSVGILSRSDYGSITFRDWTTVGIEEYGYAAPDPLDPNLVYGGKATRWDRRTSQAQDVSPVVVRTGQYRFNRTAPIIFSPVDKRALYLGSNVLFKTTDGGHSWQVISPDLTRENPGVPPNLGRFVEDDPAKGVHRGVIYSIGPSFQDADLIWIGTDDGLIQVTRDGGKSWQNVTPPELTPWSKVAQIEASHFDRQQAYAAVNRFRLDDLKPYVYRTRDGGKTWQKIVAGLPENASVNVVREDPVRKGLLFCGTERAVWVSFDDGDHWQSLQLNLPASSMRDLVVQGDDIVVGTHGRSIWILDDITPLRQVGAEAAAATAYLFKPQLATRVRRSTNTDTPLPPEEPHGQNPPDGAIINYYLKAPARGDVVVQIHDAQGRLVRRYSSADPPERIHPDDYPIPMYWVRPPRVLPSGAGMHRWTWDLHFPPPPSQRSGYPISAIPHDTPRGPHGARALPGQYTVTLTVDGTTLTQPLTLRMDPRVTTAPAGLASQQALQLRITAAMTSSYQGTQEVRSLRGQLKPLAAGANAAIAQAAHALDVKATEFEAGGARREAFAAINGSLGSVLQAVDAADAAPTTQQEAAVAALQQTLNGLLARWNAVKAQELERLNRQLRDAGLPPIDLSKLPSAPRETE